MLSWLLSLLLWATKSEALFTPARCALHPDFLLAGDNNVKIVINTRRVVPLERSHPAVYLLFPQACADVELSLWVYLLDTTSPRCAFNSGNPLPACVVTVTR